MTADPLGAPGRVLWRALIRFEPRKIVPQVAIRNTLGFACAVILGTILASPSTGVVAGSARSTSAIPTASIHTGYARVAC